MIALLADIAMSAFIFKRLQGHDLVLELPERGGLVG
jgi:hypothetical protein